MSFAKLRFVALLASQLSLISCGAVGSACSGSEASRLGTRTSEARAQHTPTSHTVATPQPSAAPFRVATFNGGLALGVLPLVGERAPLVATALARLPVDLLCVQEMWLEPDWARLRDRTKDTLPESVRPPAHEFVGEAKCSVNEARPVFSCVRRQCRGVAEARLGACAATKCGRLAVALSAPCTACLTRDPLRSIAEVEVECMERAALPAVKRARSAERAYVYGGSYGLGLLTRAELLHTSFLHLTSERLARGVVYAKVRHTVGVGDVHVFCTHLTAEVSGVPYPLGGGSWRAEHAQQIGELLGFIERQVPAGEAAILLGDLNTGPADLPKIRGRRAEQYARILARGFSNPYLQEASRDCSFCYSNPLNGGTAAYGILIDHVLLHGSLRALTARRVLDEPIELSVRGKSVRSAYSDHYGIAVELERARD